jgi:hypothetical protein
VTSVLEHRGQADSQVYEVRVLDGRRFVVRRQVDADGWELVAVYDRRTRQRQQSRFGQAAVLLLLLAITLSRKALHFAKRALWWRSHAQQDLPKGGAAA